MNGKTHQMLESVNKFAGGKSHVIVPRAKAFEVLNRLRGSWQVASARMLTTKEANDVFSTRKKS